MPEYFSTNPLNRTGQHILLDEVSPLTDIDESKAAGGVGADVDSRARWEGFVGFGRLQCVPKSYRIVPNLAGGVLLFGTPLDQLLAAPTIQAGNFGTGRDVRFNQPLPAALAGVFSHRHSLLHCFGVAILSDYSP